MKTLRIDDVDDIGSHVWTELALGQRKRFFEKLKKMYHIEGSLRDPEKALIELMLRILYEFLMGFVSYDDLRYINWKRSSNRDPHHGIRILKLCRKASRDELCEVMWLNGW